MALFTTISTDEIHKQISSILPEVNDVLKSMYDVGPENQSNSMIYFKTTLGVNPFESYALAAFLWIPNNSSLFIFRIMLHFALNSVLSVAFPKLFLNSRINKQRTQGRGVHFRKLTGWLYYPETAILTLFSIYEYNEDIYSGSTISKSTKSHPDFPMPRCMCTRNILYLHIFA